MEITKMSSQHCNISHNPDLKGNNGCDLRISCSVGVTLILFSVAYPCAIRNVLNFPKSQIDTTHKCRYPCNLLPMWKGFSPCSSSQISPCIYYPPVDSWISTAWMRPFSSVSTRWTVIILPASSCLTAIQHSAGQLPPTGTTLAMRHSIT